MPVLSPQELSNLNVQMLQKGAPVEIDSTGYNQPDFITCRKMTGVLSNEDCFTVSKVLKKYAKTQLSLDITIITETINHYSTYEKGKYVYVIKVDEDGAWCKWGYNPELVGLLKQDALKGKYKWAKLASGEYECRINHSTMPEVISQLQSIKINCMELLEVKKPIGTSSTVKEATTTTANTSNSQVILMKVKRKDNDCLELTFPYNGQIVSLLGQVPTAYFNKGTQSWLIDLIYATDAYKLLSKATCKVDLKQLKPWADLMKFDSKYTLKEDFSHVPFTPRDYQIQDAKEMLKNKGFINANDMGVGKTFECVIMGESLPFPKLIICPATLKINWKKEIKMVNPNADIVVLQSSDTFKIGKDWTIIGFPSVAKHLKNLEKQYFKCIIADEAHFVKAINSSGNPDSQRGNAVLRLAKTAEYSFPVTGTPKTNRNKDLFNLLKMVRHPLTLGKWAFTNFGKMYCDAESTPWGTTYDGSSNDADLYEKIHKYMVRHLKSEVLPNIKKMRTFIPCDVNLKEYDAEIAEYLKTRKNKQGESLVRLMKAKQILAKKKAPVTIDFAKDILEQGKKVIIVTCFSDVVNQVETAFKGNCVKIVGGMSDIAKDKSVEEFQTGSAMVCVMNIVAGGVGLTLTASHHVIVNDFDWTPGNMVQAEDRSARSGQEFLTNVFYMYAENAIMDELLAEVLTEKFETINSAIDGGKGEDVNLQDMIEAMLVAKQDGNYDVKEFVKSTRTSPPNKVQTLEPIVKLEPSVVVSEKKQLKSLDNLKYLTYEELVSYAKSLKIDWKTSTNLGIDRMRMTIAIRKVLQ